MNRLCKKNVINFLCEIEIGILVNDKMSLTYSYEIKIDIVTNRGHELCFTHHQRSLSHHMDFHSVTDHS